MQRNILELRSMGLLRGPTSPCVFDIDFFFFTTRTKNIPGITNAAGISCYSKLELLVLLVFHKAFGHTTPS